MRTIDYRAMSGAEMLEACGDDAKKWADAFCQINPIADPNFMMGWFANAIEQSTTVRCQRKATTT